ncbi:peroxiredoxin-like family protein [Lewinella sp. 4G2]|uniref:peroxiredoxin-like family protein n=1 Tax=Lewinella sp. 4G2 TaxID=1803372 RepID=UPI0007B4D161|nr:peroxiredoxin-like family protein [Lewinella sp. 4G2]OAV45675.1 alkyl hydroperoxide reductase [Lewinella sp. 4G2]
MTKQSIAVKQAQRSLPEMETMAGASVLELSHNQPVLLVFLRHFGCTFCREALQDLSEKQSAIARHGAKLMLVHMSDKETSDRYFKKYGLAGIDSVSDPSCTFYQAFGLTKGTARQLFGLHSWIRGFEAGVLNGHGVGYQQLGDGFQMPGVFVIRDGRVRGKFVHKLAGDRPDYIDLLDQCCQM